MVMVMEIWGEGLPPLSHIEWRFWKAIKTYIRERESLLRDFEGFFDIFDDVF